jgi:hypothetical protein
MFAYCPQVYNGFRNFPRGKGGRPGILRKQDDAGATDMSQWQGITAGPNP